MASTDESSGVDMSDVFGPVYWGFVVSLFLGGITVIQAWIYFPHPNDRLSIQLTALAMLILDVTSSVLVAQSIYYYMVPHFGATFQLGSVTPELSAECLISGFMTFISQGYFVYQLYTIRHIGAKVHRMVIVVITLCAILGFAGGTACVVAMIIYKHGVLANRSPMFAIFFGLAKGFGALTDILATIALCRFLSSSKTSAGSTKYMVKSLINWIVERGVVVTLIQTLLLITFYTFPDRLHWFAFHMNVTKLYANTFFAMLNARGHLKEKINAKSSFVASASYSGHRAHIDIRGKQFPDPIDIAAEEREQKNSFSMHPMPTVTTSVLTSY